MRATDKTGLRPTTYVKRHGLVSLFFFIFLFLLSEIKTVGAQSGPTQDNGQYPYASFSPSMAVVIAVLVAALFFMGFFSIYIRHCYDAPTTSGSRGRALSMRARRAAAARGLGPSVIETFPTFSYSEVKDHKIGKGALECAVCLNEFEDDETLRLLPKCDHVFHPECIDLWLESHVTCPVCRANLAPQTGDEPVETTADDPAEVVEGGNSRNEEVVVQVDDNQEPGESRNPSSDNSNRPSMRSGSMKRPKFLGFGKYRSHSTGHSLVQPGENLERFTLRLPEGVRKEVLNRAMLNRAASFAGVLVPTEGSSRRGYRTGSGEGSSRAGRFYRRIEVPGRDVKSDRWASFMRVLSMKSPRFGVETGEGSVSKRSGSRTPVKMPSFKCLEPKTDGGDENRPLSGQSPV